MTKYFLTLLLLSLALPCLCMFEDQAGTTDWYQQYLGPIKFARFHKTKPKLFVGTNEGVLGCLNLKNGSIAWRIALGGTNQLDAMLVLEKPAVVLSLSEGGKYLRSWESAEGGIRWEATTVSSDRPIKATAAQPSLHIVPGPFSSTSVLAWNGTHAQAFDLTDGQLLWRRDAFTAQHAGVDVTDDKITLVGLTPNEREVQVAQLAPRDGRVASKWQIHFPRKLSSVFLVHEGYITVVAADQQHLCTAALAEGAHPACSVLSQLGINVGSSPKLALVPTRAGVVAVSLSRGSPGGALLVRREGALQLHANFPEAIGASDAIGLNADDEVVGVVEAAGKGVKIKVVDTSSGAVVHEEEAADVGLGSILGPLPDVSSALLGAYKRKSSPSDGFRLLLSWEGGSVALVQQGQAVWVRDESLGSVSKAIFLDLPPVSSPLVKQELKNNPVRMMTLDDQIKMQILSIKVQFNFNTEEEKAELAEMRNNLSDKNRPYRDSNGFRKMIVALTRAGKVHALHTGNGRQLWSLSLDAAAVPDYILQWRAFHDVEHPPQLLLLRTGPKPVATIINAHTGEVVETTHLPYDVSKVIPVHQALHDGKADQTLLLLVSGSEAQDNLKVHPFPASPAASSFLASHYASLFFWLHNPEARTFTGYGFAQKSWNAAEASITPTHIWQLTLPDPVLALSARDPSEPVHSYVKVLGNRSLQYKYLNPNTLFVATGPAPGSSVEGEAPLTFYLLDTVTGRLLHRQQVNGGQGPVTAAFSENFVIVQYFNTETSRFEMTVLELYDVQPRTFNMWDAITGISNNESISSLPPAVLEIHTQSYFSRSPLKAMAVTRTLRGITSKQILLLTGSDQVYALHKRFVDPRRPMKQKLTNEEMEEQLIPYNPELLLYPTQFVTLDKQVANLAGVTVAPAYLESAMHLFAYGTDLFYIRISPANAYDSLDPDFSYALLLLVLLALVAVVFGVQYTANKSMLKEKWK